MTNTPDAYLSHRLPGRARIRVPSRRGNGRYFADVKSQLAGCAGVQGVEASPVTGSILLWYADDIIDVVNFARNQNLFSLTELEPAEIPLAVKVRGELSAMDARVRRFANGELDLWTVVSLALLITAFIQLLRGNIAGPALTVGWTATNAMMMGLKGASGRQG